MFIAFDSVLFFVLFSLIHKSFAVLSSAKSPSLLSLKHCLVNQGLKPNLRECIGRSALKFLQHVEEHDNFTLSQGFVVLKDEKVASRSFANFHDIEPLDFRAILENAGAVFSQRSLELHMDAVFPGLMFKVGPSSDAKSVAEFVLDPAINERNFITHGEPSTARIITKQYLLPFLLGLKFNLAALMPLLFAVIFLLLKKSLFLAKLAFYVSSLLGVSGQLASLATLGGAVLSGRGNADFAGHNFINQYDEYAFHHNTLPHKRSSDRKMIFDEPRQMVSRSVLPVQNNRFYYNRDLLADNFLPSEQYLD